MNKTFQGKFLMRRAMDSSGIPCVVIAGIGITDKEFIASMNDCDEMWIGEVEFRPKRKLKELRSLSGGPKPLTLHEFVEGKCMHVEAWMKEEVDGKDVPNDDYTGLGT